MLDGRHGRAGIKGLLHTLVLASMAQLMCLSRYGTFRFPELGAMIPDPRYWPALIGNLLVDLPAMGGQFKGVADEGGIGTLVCVGAAGSAQEEGEVCEDTLQRNVVLITPFSSSGIPPYIRLSTR
jgi:hypothetical protein